MARTVDPRLGWNVCAAPRQPLTEQLEEPSAYGDGTVLTYYRDAKGTRYLRAVTTTGHMWWMYFIGE